MALGPPGPSGSCSQQFRQRRSVDSSEDPEEVEEFVLEDPIPEDVDREFIVANEDLDTEYDEVLARERRKGKLKKSKKGKSKGESAYAVATPSWTGIVLWRRVLIIQTV